MSEILTQGLHLVWEFVLRPMVPVVSLALFLGLFQRWILKSSVANLAQISVGIIMSAIGLILFSLGLRLGLVPLGDMVGQGLTSQAGLGMLIIFALILGYGATVAEPALAAMGMQVENVTAGAFKKRFLVHGVAIGVAIGVTAGILRIVYDISLLVMALPALVLVALLALKTPARYLAIAWDSGGVTTGPITVPLVLSLGLGIASGKGGFGIITLASLGPIIAITFLGLILNWRANKSNVG